MWLLLVVCLQNLGDYWTRHVRPDWTEEFASEIDDEVDELLKTCVGVDAKTWSFFAKERLRLPMSLRGCGLRQAAGAIAQSIPQLLNRKDVNGNKIEGRLPIN